MATANWLEFKVKRINVETQKSLFLWLADGKDYWVPKAMVWNIHNHTCWEKDITLLIKDVFVEQMGPVGKLGVPVQLNDDLASIKHSVQDGKNG